LYYRWSVRPLFACLALCTVGCGATTPSGGAAQEACAGPLTTLVKGRPIWGFNVAVDSTSVYWTQFGGGDGAPELHSVWKVPIAGGEPSLVWEGSSFYLLGMGMAVGGGEVFWSGDVHLGDGGSGGAAFSAPTAGGPARNLGSIGPYGAGGGVGFDGTSVYASDAATITKIPRGGTPKTLWSRSSATKAQESWFVVQGGQVFFVTLDPEGAGATMVVSADGGPATTLAPLGGNGIAVDDSRVYVASGDSVFSLPLRGGTPQRLASGLANPRYLAVDATGIYVANFGTDTGGAWLGGSVSRIPLEGGTPVTLASGQDEIGPIVLDANSVFWARELGDGAVLRVGKCSR
jgi:hypothetical protein